MSPTIISNLQCPMCGGNFPTGGGACAHGCPTRLHLHSFTPSAFNGLRHTSTFTTVEAPPVQGCEARPFLWGEPPLVVRVYRELCKAPGVDYWDEDDMLTTARKIVALLRGR